MYMSALELFSRPVMVVWHILADCIESEEWFFVKRLENSNKFTSLWSLLFKSSGKTGDFPFKMHLLFKNKEIPTSKVYF
jgi:hypothetical protein